jgi:hypothetical protein
LTCSSGLHEQQSIFIAYSLSAKWRAPFVWCHQIGREHGWSQTASEFTQEGCKILRLYFTHLLLKFCDDFIVN